MIELDELVVGSYVDGLDRRGTVQILDIAHVAGPNGPRAAVEFRCADGEIRARKLSSVEAAHLDVVENPAARNLPQHDAVLERWPLSLYSTAVADDDAWSAHLAKAWIAVVDVEGHHEPPPQPTRVIKRGHVSKPPIMEISAYWAPLFHLLGFGLGWNSMSRGLHRWHLLGRPRDGGVLDVVDRWWGDHIPAIFAHPNSQTMDAGRRSIHPDSPYRPIAEAGSWWDARIEPELRTAWHADPKAFWHDSGPDLPWKRAWGGEWNSMHMIYHWPPHIDDEQAGYVRIVTDDRSTRAAMFCDRYGGWYDALRTQAPRGGPCRVDVIVKPLGSLGTYRRSTLTGAWFSGRHRWHELGW